MKVEFKFKDKISRIELENINLFYGGSLSRKTELSILFESVFKGIEKEALVNRTEVHKNEYEVLRCDASVNIEDELKLTSKTIIAKEIKKALSRIDSDELNEVMIQLNNAISIVSKQLNSSWEELGISHYEEFMGEFNFNDFNKLIKDNYTFYSEESKSKSSNRIAYYQLCQSYLNRHTKSICIIDDFDSDLDLIQCLKMIESFKVGNITFILFVKSAELCSYCINQHPVFLMNHSLKEYQNFINERLYQSIIQENEMNELRYFDNQDFNQKNEEYRRFNNTMLEILGTKDIQSTFDFFEKTNLIDKKTLFLLKKILF